MTGLEKLCSMVTNRFGKTRKQKQSNNGRYVLYYRVSTKQQGESGLGLEAQRAAVEAYIKQHGGEIIAEYEEIESGKDCRRPKIIEAILHCHRSWATLLIAKMDRLARNVFFISTLMESGVPFLACDNPHASRLNVHVLAAVADAGTTMSVKPADMLHTYLPTRLIVTSTQRESLLHRPARALHPLHREDRMKGFRL